MSKLSEFRYIIFASGDWIKIVIDQGARVVKVGSNWESHLHANMIDPKLTFLAVPMKDVSRIVPVDEPSH